MIFKKAVKMNNTQEKPISIFKKQEVFLQKVNGWGKDILTKTIYLFNDKYYVKSKYRASLQYTPLLNELKDFIEEQDMKIKELVEVNNYLLRTIEVINECSEHTLCKRCKDAVDNAINKTKGN